VKFDFSNISFSEIKGISLLSPTSFGSNAECVEPVFKSGSPLMNSENEAAKLLDAFLKPSTGGMKKDLISDFYSDLHEQSVSNIRLEKNISNQ
jgi:hypothetical protein